MATFRILQKCNIFVENIRTYKVKILERRMEIYKCQIEFTKSTVNDSLGYAYRNKQEKCLPVALQNVMNYLGERICREAECSGTESDLAGKTFEFEISQIM